MKQAVLSFCLLACLTLPARAADWYVIAAGNNLGQEADPALKYAERDANLFATVMQRLGGVPAQNTILLLGQDANSLRRVVLDVNARIRTGHMPGESDSVLLLFYSGHADATGLHLGDTSLEYAELESMLVGSPARVRLLVIDSCRSGGVTRVKGASGADEFEIKVQNHLQAEGLAIITSSTAGEDSHESDAIRASFFSHHLINALRGVADKNRDGLVTLEEAYRYTYLQTLRSSGRTWKLQHPTFRYDLRGKGELVLTRLANDRNRSGRLVIAEPGYYLVIEHDEQGPVTAEVAVGSRGTRLVLPAGRYFVQKRAPTHFREYEINVAAGEEIDLARTEHRTVEYARLLRKGGGERRVISGLVALGGVRNAILPGESVSGHLVLGTSLDFSWLSLGFRGRFTRAFAYAHDGLTDMTHTEVGLGLIARRYLDFSSFSLSLGLLVELVYHHQQFQPDGMAPDRTAWGFGFGGLFAIEIPVSSSLGLVVEGGPLTQVYRRGLTEGGEEIGSELTSAFTWWAAAGLGWRF